ncbi:MAG: hypothetical protein AAF533_05175 [Acidobacteriota bacterium]
MTSLSTSSLLTGLALAALTGAATSTQPQPGDVVFPSPTPATVAAWRDHVLPPAEELAWESIPWVPTFFDGMREAGKQDKPLLFWAMNGHPLGCT